MAYLIALHSLAATIWVGGLFFLVGVLRPAASSVPLGERLPLLSVALGRFFLWIWIAIFTLLITGYAMTGLLGGIAVVPPYINIMQALAWVMMALYAHMFFAPWKRVRAALAAGALADAGRAMNQLRLFATASLWIGLLIIAIATGGSYGLL
ncbi:MAG: CopD family protein [Salinisphaera sp.]|uniref:CopD family protein n=1 Tax=Salinisphaera sp. TaxID=1914330 RepID=UPI003C79EB43